MGQDVFETFFFLERGEEIFLEWDTVQLNFWEKGKSKKPKSGLISTDTKPC
jgi:hypothetical protein